MNIQFIIGNGFDLNLDMNTTYQHFYKYYRSIKSGIPLIEQLKIDIKNKSDNWSDLELALGQYTRNINDIREFDLIFDDLGAELAKFLKREEDDFKNKTIDREKFINDLVYPEIFLGRTDKENIKSFRRNFENINWNVDIVTFNYTRTIEEIVEEKQHLNKSIYKRGAYSVIFRGIEHIHGYLNKRMVMGVNDKSQIANKSFHTNIDILESLIKNNCNQIMKHAIDNDFKRKINSANLICIFGSSLGATDMMWWDLIGQRLLDDSCRLIIFDKCEEIDERAFHKYGRIERRIKSKFLNRTNLENHQKNLAKERIYVGLNTNIFNILIKNKVESEVLAG